MLMRLALQTYGAYVWVPILATVVWLADILGLLLWWIVADDRRNCMLFQCLFGIYP